jgi:hypothetical protein
MVARWPEMVVTARVVWLSCLAQLSGSVVWLSCLAQLSGSVVSSVVWLGMLLKSTWSDAGVVGAAGRVEADGGGGPVVEGEQVGLLVAHVAPAFGLSPVAGPLTSFRDAPGRPLVGGRLVLEV